MEIYNDVYKTIVIKNVFKQIDWFSDFALFKFTSIVNPSKILPMFCFSLFFDTGFFFGMFFLSFILFLKIYSFSSYNKYIVLL